MEIVDTITVDISSSKTYFKATAFCNGQGHVPSGKITFKNKGREMSAYPNDSMVKYDDGRIEIIRQDGECCDQKIMGDQIRPLTQCSRCGEVMNDKDEAEGCRDFACPLLG